ncbi:serine/threonine-protein kinase [Streptomyces nanshensis]|uniref:serine/threonine-protein kinase n=1 Tax=Streptomyces nanshensis TaxID=518642 RepID=UPI00099F6CFD
MGRVYLARSDRGRTVAVKVVQAELARQPDFRRRFAKEINAARRVGDAWTAAVLDADTEAATPWVATGYVAGPSLQEVVDGLYGPLPQFSVTALASGLVRALEAIHGAGLVHRDLKPSNILITIDGPRVIDFGIAHALHTAAGGGLTRTGAVIGSPGFMSPEQVRGETVTPASDVFCLGAVLAYAATGRMPFGTSADGIHALLFRVAEKEPDLTGLDGSLREPVAACLHKTPAERPSAPALLTAFGDGSALDGTWLPAEVLAQLDRHAVRFLDSEEPDARVGHQPTQLDGAGAPLAGPGTPPASAGTSGPSPYGDATPHATPHALTATAPGPSPHAGQRTPHHQVPGPADGPAPGRGPTRPVQPLRSLAGVLIALLGVLSAVTVAKVIVDLRTYSRLSGLQKPGWQLLLDSGRLDGHRLATDVTTVLTVVTVLPVIALTAAVLAILVVRRLTGWQERRLAR